MEEPATTLQPAIAPGEPPVPDRLGRFLVRREIGRGGMGRVLLATDPNLGREVAVKLLHDAIGCDLSSRVARFLAEGRIASGLDHPAIIPVHELGFTGDGQPFLVMRHIEGSSMRELLHSGGATPIIERQRLLAILVQVCQAVGHAHRRGVVHRDLKPENIMVGAHDEVYVVDWGIAALRGALEPSSPDPAVRTQDGTVLGTLGYMPPEAAQGDVASIGPPSDVFSLGAMLYEVLAGCRPFDAPDPYLATLIGRFAPLCEVAPGVDPDLAALCERALATLPVDRFADAGELAGALQAWVDGATRRARADERVAEGRAALGRWEEGHTSIRSADARIAGLERSAPAWLPLAHPEKVALREERARRTAGLISLAGTFAEVEAAGEAAMALDPSNAGARALLADALWLRLVEAERRGDPVEVAYSTFRLRSHDDGSRLARLRAPGRVSLRTRPDGAEVVARRFDRSGIVWELEEPIALGRTPLDAVALPPGSWILTIDAPGCRPTRYPVRVERGGNWEVHAARPLHLLTETAVDSGWVYVPEGPFISGGDPEVSFPRPVDERWVDGFVVREYAVTAEEYASWLAHLHATGADWAARAPRVPSGAGGAGGRMWPGEPPFRFPLRDQDGDLWDPRWAICGVSHTDAVAFAEWRSSRLPSEDEYEKAARGVDGRRYPWGGEFDAGACKSAETRQGRPRPEAVGCIPTDRSPYGVADLAGVMRTWCAESSFNGDGRLRPTRGGYWAAGARMCRPANRFAFEPAAVQAHLGIRLVRSLPHDPQR